MSPLGYNPGRYAEVSWEMFEGRSPGHVVLWDVGMGTLPDRSRVMTAEATAAQAGYPHLEKELRELLDCPMCAFVAEELPLGEKPSQVQPVLGGTGSPALSASCGGTCQSSCWQPEASYLGFLGAAGASALR